MGGRHFHGHGVHSPDGRLLYATENDFDAVRGVLGIYEVARGYRRIGEMDSHGVGPHEVVAVPGTSLLVVANGGLRTQPDTGREKLNLDSMEPSLAIIDARGGGLPGCHTLPDAWHQVSIRHLAYGPDGDVWFACQ